MMSKILKVKNREALKGAIDLGIAMQLTNIARDVCEDKTRNRQYVEHDFFSIKEIIGESQIFYDKSFYSISSIPLKSRFSVIVARRVYRKIGDYILKQKNIENYNNAGKIYVPVFEKIIQTFLSIFDFVKLLFVKELSYENHLNHTILEKEVNLNEREFDYVIIGGGCAGLSLAYELEINDRLKNKTLAIIENRKEYKRDKTWSFWKVFDHNFDDCVIKSWNNFTINTSENSHELTNQKFPYQSIDSGKFYNKISSKLSNNSNVSFIKILTK